MSVAPNSASLPGRNPLRSQAVQVTLGLLLGLALGMWLSHEASPSAFTRGLIAVLDVVGTAWINAVRMTVIPLVVPLLIVGVAGGGDTSLTGRVGAKAFAWMLGLAIACAIFTVVVAPPWFNTLLLDPEATARLRATASIDSPPADALSLRTWIRIRPEKPGFPRLPDACRRLRRPAGFGPESGICPARGNLSFNCQLTTCREGILECIP